MIVTIAALLPTFILILNWIFLRSPSRPAEPSRAPHCIVVRMEQESGSCRNNMKAADPQQRG